MLAVRGLEWHIAFCCFSGHIVNHFFLWFESQPQLSPLCTLSNNRPSLCVLAEKTSLCFHSRTLAIFNPGLYVTIWTSRLHQPTSAWYKHALLSGWWPLHLHQLLSLLFLSSAHISRAQYADMSQSTWHKWIVLVSSVDHFLQLMLQPAGKSLCGHSRRCLLSFQTCISLILLNPPLQKNGDPEFPKSTSCVGGILSSRL